MRTLLLKLTLALLLAAPFAQALAAGPGGAAPLLLAQAGKAPVDDEDDEEPVTKPATPAPAPAPAPAAEGAVSTGVATSTADEQKLVSGAPLYNPNVAVHIVEQKSFSDRMRLELTLYGDVQVNGKFNQHIGGMASVLWHLQENFGLQVSGFWNPWAVESDFNAELVRKTSQEAQAATSLLSIWGVLGGVEVTPLYGKFALFEGTLAHFSIVLNAGAGAGGTRHQLKPASEVTGPATYGDTGVRFLGEIGGGFRLQLGKRFAFRVEVKDIVYTARVEAVEGCDAGDLNAINDAVRLGRPVSDASVAPLCRIERWDGVNEQTGQKNSTDVPLALNLVRTPSSDVLNNVGFYLGISVLIP